MTYPPLDVEAEFPAYTGEEPDEPEEEPTEVPVRDDEPEPKPAIIPTPAEEEFRAPPLPPEPPPTEPDRPGGQVATVGGEKLYIEGSTMWEKGFRNVKEHVAAQSRQSAYGLHEGKLIPEGSVILTTKAGKPYTRYTQSELEKGEVDPSYLAPYFEEKKYKIPVITHEGKEKLFTPQEYERAFGGYEAAKPEQQFTMLQEAEIFPAGAQFSGLDAEGNYLYIPKEELKQAKEQELIVIANQEAINKLEPYMDEQQMVDGARYLRDNPKDSATLKDAGFTLEDVTTWREYNKQIGVKLPVLGWSANTEVQSQVFKNRVTELLVTRPHLSQVEAENITITEFRAKGLPLEKSPDLPKQIKLANAYFKTLSPEEQAAHLKQAKGLPITAAEMFIPGVYVARHWGTLSTKEKAVQIGIDAAFVLTGIGIFKLVGASSRVMAGVSKSAKLADRAGKTGKELIEAKKAFDLAQKVGRLEVGSPLWVKHANNVAKLQRQSMKADGAFLKSFGQLKNISPKQLKQIEKLSGLKGMSSTVKGISQAEKKLAQAWKQLDKLKFNPNATTAKQIAINNKYLRQLANVEKAQVNLQAALSRAGSTLKPRYTPSPPAAEFKGYGMGWESGKAAPTIDTAGDGTIKAIESYLARNSELKETGREFWVAPSRVAVAVAEKPKVTPKATLKLKAIYTKAKPKPIPKTAVPKVKASVLPRIKPVVKVTSKAAAVDAVAKTLEEHLSKYKPFTQIGTATRQDIKAVTQAGIEAMVSAQTKGLTASGVKEAVLQAIKALALTKPSLATNVAVVTKTATKVIIASPPTLLKPFVLKPRLPILKLPIPELSKEEAKKRIVGTKGALCWRQGTVRKGKGRVPVWYVILAPYESRKDAFIMHEPPPGAKVVKGKKSAYNTIQQLTGKAPSFILTLDLGGMDIKIDNPVKGAGKPQSISFEPDWQQRTVSRINLSKPRIKKARKKPKREYNDVLGIRGMRL